MNSQNQRGSTLVIVLLFLVVITVIGTLAIRQSMTSLNVATNSQVQQLLMQSSDAVLYRIGKANLSGSIGNPSSMLGYSLKNIGSEVIFCFRSQLADSTSFSVGNTSLLVWNDTNSEVVVNGVSGFCDLKSQHDYASSRKAQMTQVTILANPLSNLTSKPLQTVTLGTDMESIGKRDEDHSKRIRVYVTSILPNMTSTSEEKILACLRRPNEKPLVGNAETMDACLTRENVPFNTQMQDFLLDTYLSVAT